MSRSNLSGRSRINAPSKDLLEDNGTVLLSVVDGEQIHLDLKLNWLTNLTGMTLTCKVVEASNDGLGTKPTDTLIGGQVVTLSILDNDTTDNEIKLVIPKNLAENFAVQPTVDKPVYGFIGLEIADLGVGDNQQIWKPFRGLIEILYSPSEA